MHMCEIEEALFLDLLDLQKKSLHFQTFGEKTRFLKVSYEMQLNGGKDKLKNPNV